MRLISYIRLRRQGFSVNAARRLSEKYADHDDMCVGYAAVITIVGLAYLLASNS